MLLFYVHGKHLRSCRDGHLTYNHTWSGSALFAYDPFKGFQVRMGLKERITIQKEITSQTDLYLVILSSKTFVFKDILTKY